MRLLALETSSRRLSLAAFENGICVRALSVEALMRQNESLAPLVHSLLEQLAWNAGDLGAVALSLGPGSFTGLRTGLAFAKGICFASGAKLVGIPTLEAWAENAGAPETLVWLDARRGLVYRGRYRLGQELVEPAMIPMAEAQAEERGAAAWVGDLPGMQGSCDAEAVGRLALKRLEIEGPDAPESLEPIYLRRPEAEILWEKRHGV